MGRRAAQLVQTDHLPPGHTNGQPNHDVHRANDKAVEPPFALRNVAGTEIDGTAPIAVVRERDRAVGKKAKSECCH